MDAEILDKMPPADVDAERQIIGSIFLLPDVIDDVSLVVSKADFYDARSGIMFELLQQMHNDQRRIDVKLFIAAAKKAGVWEKIPAELDASHVAECVQSVQTAAHAKYYAELVRDAAIKRELKHVGTMIVQAGQDERIEATDAMNRSEQMVLEIRDRRGAMTSNSVDVGTILGDAMETLDKRASGQIKPGLETTFPGLDELIGFRGSELIILAARPSMGKTALALNIAAGVAGYHQNPVMMFSLEMNSASVGERLLSSGAEIDGSRMRSGNLSLDDRRRLVEYCAELSKAKLTIDDSFRMTVQDIAAVCRRHKRRHGLSLVIVDYLQLIQAENPRDQREQQVSRISSRLKGVARELDVPVLCLCQLNRQVESAKDNRPRLSHLRESGAIEQDADVVAFVHRPEYFMSDSKDKLEAKGKSEIYVEKNRNGRTGMVPLLWHDRIVTFSSALPDNYEHSFDAYNESAEV